MASSSLQISIKRKKYASMSKRFENLCRNEGALTKKKGKFTYTFEKINN